MGGWVACWRPPAAGAQRSSPQTAHGVFWRRLRRRLGSQQAARRKPKRPQNEVAKRLEEETVESRCMQHVSANIAISEVGRALEVRRGTSGSPKSYEGYCKHMKTKHFVLVVLIFSKFDVIHGYPCMDIDGYPYTSRVRIPGPFRGAAARVQGGSRYVEGCRGFPHLKRVLVYWLFGLLSFGFSTSVF